MKKHLLFIFTALLPLLASAQTKVEIDGIWYNLTAETREAVVASSGGTKYSGSITIPATVTYEGVNYSVTSFASNAFQYCSSLTAITLPAEGVSIANYSLAFCSSLTDVYCYAETVPNTGTEAFYNSNIENATLHVPASAIDAYKNTAPWSSFGTIKAIENVILEKCATPTINYRDGKVVFACDTEEATVKSNFIENIAGSYNDMEVAFIPTYTLTAYATKENYENSDEVTLTICWVPCEETHEGGTTGILTIPAKPVLIQCQGGVITLSGLDEGTEVAVFTTGSIAVATATATDGTATLTTGLEAGTIAIVKIGNSSIKVVIK